MNKDIIILGTGNNSLELLEMTEHPGLPDLRVIGFLDDGLESGTAVHGVPVLGRLDEAAQFKDAWFVNGIGSPGNHAVRDGFIGKTGLTPDRFISIIHPTASVSRRATIGRGVVLFQNVVVGTGAILGDHVIVLPQTTISHDTRVGAHTCLATGVILSGNCAVGERCYLGAGSVTRENVVIGSGSLVGAGAVVIKDVDPECRVAGNPARLL